MAPGATHKLQQKDGSIASELVVGTAIEAFRANSLSPSYIQVTPIDRAEAAPLCVTSGVK